MEGLAHFVVYIYLLFQNAMRNSFPLDHRFSVQSDGVDDGAAAVVDADLTENDERSRNEERNGKFEFEQNGR